MVQIGTFAPQGRRLDLREIVITSCQVSGTGGPSPLRGCEPGTNVSSEDDDGPFHGAVRIAIEDAIDLHAFHPSETGSVVEAYLEAAAQAGFREVRVIHGRGTGAQRAHIRRVLARSDVVERFADAPPERGGWGATLVWLKRAG